VVGLSPNAVSLVYALGAVLLGLWLFFCHPSFGPRTLKAAFLLVAVAYGFLFVTRPATAAAEAFAGPTAALLCAYVPILTLVFWSALHLLRVTIATVADRG
jgi:hypothetical protein